MIQVTPQGLAPPGDKGLSPELPPSLPSSRIRAFGGFLVFADIVYEIQSRYYSKTHPDKILYQPVPIHTAYLLSFRFPGSTGSLPYSIIIRFYPYNVKRKVQDFIEISIIFSLFLHHQMAFLSRPVQASRHPLHP